MEAEEKKSIFRDDDSTPTGNSHSNNNEIDQLEEESTHVVEQSTDDQVIGETTLEMVSSQIAHLFDLVETRLGQSEQQDKFVAALLDELNQYKTDFLYKHFLGQLFRDLIQLYDTVEQSLNASESTDVEKMAARYRRFQQIVIKILNRQKVELIETNIGDQFDAANQEAVDIEPVPTQKEDGTVCDVVFSGFTYQDRVVRPAQVIVGKHQPQSS